MNPNITANEAALFFLQENQKKKEPDFITNMKLQKLLYYAQGYALALLGRPLFADPIEKWKHGPVVPNVYHNYKAFHANAIWVPFSEHHWPEEDAYIMIKVEREKGRFTASELSRQTHCESPWQSTHYDHEIPKEKMYKFFHNILAPDAINFDVDKIEASLNSGIIEVPHFQTAEEFMTWFDNNAGKLQ